MPTFKRHEIANQCIHSILACQIAELEIIVVNDDPNIPFKLNNPNTSVRIITNPGKGVASARNFGASNANSKNLIFVDDDMLLNKETILNAIEFIESNPNTCYNANWVYPENILKKISNNLFGRYLIRNHFTTLEGWNNREIEWKNNTMLKSDGITSQFLAIKKKDFEEAGKYNENFPYAGFEDHDLCIKLKKQGIQNYIDTRVLIYHNESDRMDVKSWLDRKKRGAFTQKVAVKMGYTEVALHYSIAKKNILSLLSFTKPLFHLLLKLIPNHKVFDPFFNLLFNLLFAVSIFEGYTQNEDATK